MLDTATEISTRSVTIEGRHCWTGKPRGGLFLALCCLVGYVPGIFVLPPIDRDEARFAEATRRMLASDDWSAYVLPQFGGRARINKPPLTYWVQAPVVTLMHTIAGDTPAADARAETADASSEVEARPSWYDPGWVTRDIWAYRMTSILAAICAALLTWRLGLMMFAPPAAWMAGLLLGGCILVQFDARQARADQILLATTVLAQLALWKLWRDRPATPGGRTFWVGLLWIAIALGTLAKGPVTPAVCGLTALTLAAVTRDWKWLRELRIGWGLVIILGTTLPWLIAVALHPDIGWKRISIAVLQETFVRSAKVYEGHGFPPGYHTLLLPVLFWPGSLALVPAFWLAFRRGLEIAPPDKPGRRSLWARVRSVRAGRPAELFCLAWFVPAWIVFELVITKLPHYPLAAYPAVALLCGRAVFDFNGVWRTVLGRRWGRGLATGWVGIGQFVGVILPLGLLIFCAFTRPWPWQVVLTVVGLVILAQFLIVIVARALRRRRVLKAQIFGLLAAGVASICVFRFVLPELEVAWLSSRMAAAINRVDPGGTRPLADVNYRVDSLIFLTNGRLERIKYDQEQNDLPAWREAHPEGLIVTADPKVMPDAPVLAEEKGLAYSEGWFGTARLLDSRPRASSQPAER